MKFKKTYRFFDPSTNRGRVKGIYRIGTRRYLAYVSEDTEQDLIDVLSDPSAPRSHRIYEDYQVCGIGYGNFDTTPFLSYSRMQFDKDGKLIDNHAFGYVKHYNILCDMQGKVLDIRELTPEFREYAMAHKLNGGLNYCYLVSVPNEGIAEEDVKEWFEDLAVWKRGEHYSLWEVKVEDFDNAEWFCLPSIATKKPETIEELKEHLGNSKVAEPCEVDTLESVNIMGYLGWKYK